MTWYYNSELQIQSISKDNNYSFLLKKMADYS